MTEPLISDLRSLLRTSGGLFAKNTLHRNYGDEPQIFTQVIHPDQLEDDYEPSRKPVLLSGAGASISPEHALTPALAEALERHCATTFLEGQYLWATADELHPEAVDLDTFPVCSDRELADPLCPLTKPSTTEKIRWIRAMSLADGARVYLPLLSVYITPPSVVAERFINPISTGCAAHLSLEMALLSALLEVIERDALSIAWLQQLPLPIIDFEDPVSVFGELWERFQCSSSALRIYFFDATTDLGIPTIYGLRVSDLDRTVHTVVACSSSLDALHACRKVMLELTSCAVWLRNGRTFPKDVRDFNKLHHGASYMGREKMALSFRFLIETPNRIPISHVAARSSSLLAETNGGRLANVVARVVSLGYSAYAAELSTDEALRVGMRVVRAVIPGLMPFSWVYRARFLGHKRLYAAPRAMGFRVRTENELNLSPQAFG